jgi:hypothetical protein
MKSSYISLKCVFYLMIFFKKWNDESPGDCNPSQTYRYETTRSTVTELFFLLHSLIRIGPLRTVTNYHHFLQNLSRLQQRKAALETKRQLSNGIDSIAIGMEIDRLNTHLESMYAHKLEVDSHLLDGGMSPIDFYAFTAEWLIRVSGTESFLTKNQSGCESEKSGAEIYSSSSSSSSSPSSSSPSLTVSYDSLPIASTNAFSALPEFIVEGMADYFIFLCRENPKQLLLSSSMTPVIAFFVVFLGSGRHIRNPYLRSKFAEVLYLFSCADESEKSSQIASIGKGLWAFFEGHSIARTYLIPSLLMLYIDIETTGRHAQFYEKFSVRRNIAILLKHLRGLPQYALKLREEASRNFPLFLRFLHRILDDSNFLLDELIMKAKDVTQIEAQMENTVEWRALPDATRQELAERHNQSLGTVQFFAMHAMETVQLLHFLTQNNAEVFMREEVVDRIAGMLNYFLDQLVGDKKVSFSPKFSKRISFQPLVVLQQVSPWSLFSFLTFLTTRYLDFRDLFTFSQ